MRKKSESLIKEFGMSNLLLEQELSSVADEYQINIRPKKTASEEDQVYYPQFDEEIRNEAQDMASHYQVFYCLEKTVRKLINERMDDSYGAKWWDEKVPQEIQGEAKKSMDREEQAGFTVRSNDPLDYTTFGHLSQIIQKNWECFGDIFNNQRAVTKIMSNLNMLRGPIAHCSLLAEDEIQRLELTLKDWFRQME
jgi:hypothetical protein